MENTTNPQQQTEITNQFEKKAYHTPKIRLYGNISAITEGNPQRGGDGNLPPFGVGSNGDCSAT